MVFLILAASYGDNYLSATDFVLKKVNLLLAVVINIFITSWCVGRSLKCCLFDFGIFT